MPCLNNSHKVWLLGCPSHVIIPHMVVPFDSWQYSQTPVLLYWVLVLVLVLVRKYTCCQEEVIFCCNWYIPRKKPKLLASYTARQSSSQSATGNSLQQLDKYLDMDDGEECLAFWHRNKSTLNKLIHPALRAPSVPAVIAVPLSEFVARAVLFHHLTAHACLTAHCLDLYFWSVTSRCCVTFTETLSVWMYKFQCLALFVFHVFWHKSAINYILLLCVA